MSPEAGTAPPPPKGVVPPSQPGGRSGFLSDVIVELGFATADTVEAAVREARSRPSAIRRSPSGSWAAGCWWR